MKLKEYLDSHCVNMKQFCKKADVSSNTLYKLISGGEVVLSVALRVERATEGRVTCQEMEPLEARKNKCGRKPKVKK